MALSPTTDLAFELKLIFCVQGVGSPLLANIYMNRFLKHWRLSGCGEALPAHVVSYADDFVPMCLGSAAIVSVVEAAAIMSRS